ncbi:MAG: 50S ribosomal protein L10 [bacterium]
MGKTRLKKKEELEKIQDKISKMKVVLFTYYSGLPVGEETKLRKTLHGANCDYLVAKKTLLKLALKDKSIENLNLDQLTKPVSVTFGYGDEVEPAKALAEFFKSHEMMEFAGGILEGKFLSASEVTALSKLPSREGLLSQLVRTVQAPISGLVTVLQGNITSLVTVLTAIKNQKPTN